MARDTHMDMVHWFRRYYVVTFTYASDDELSEHTSLTVLSGYDKQASHVISILVLGMVAS